MGKYTQAGRPLSIRFANLAADALLLESISGSEEISQPFQFELGLLAEQAVDFGQVLGEAATVTIALTNGTRRTIHGIIRLLTQGSRVAGPGGDNTFLRYRAELVPALALLGQRVQSRVFQHQSIKDILTQVLVQEWQLDVAVRLSATYHPRNFCVQYGESDLAFVSRLMEEEGISYYFEFSATGHKMHLVDNQAVFPNLAEPHSVVFDTTGGPVNHPRVRDWEKTQEFRAVKYTFRDYCFEFPDRDLTTERHAAADRSVEVGTVTHALGLQRTVNGVAMMEHYEFPGRFAHRYDGIDKSGAEASEDLRHIADDRARLVEIRLEEELAQNLSLRGSGDCGHFVAGNKFELKRHYESTVPPGSGDVFLLTRVEITANLKGTYRGSDPGEFVYDNRFTCLPGALSYRPARRTPRPRVQGPETAVVVGPSGEDIYCDKYGRVKVQFRWDRHPTAGDSSCWVRVAQPWAGQTWGALTLPRVGQEVSVAFEGGDPDRPLIQGSLYNAQQMPPYRLPDQRRQSGLVSSSGKGGDQYHELRFDDTEGKELLHIHSEKDTNQESEHDHHVQVNNDHNVTVGNTHNHTVNGTYNLTVGPGSGSGSGGGELSDAFTTVFTGGVAPTTGKNVMNTIVDGNAFFLFAGAREEVRLGVIANIFIGPIFNFTLATPRVDIDIGWQQKFGGYTQMIDTWLGQKIKTWLSRNKNAVEDQQVVVNRQEENVQRQVVAVNEDREVVEENHVAVNVNQEVVEQQVVVVNQVQEVVQQQEVVAERQEEVVNVVQSNVSVQQASVSQEIVAVNREESSAEVIRTGEEIVL